MAILMYAEDYDGWGPIHQVNPYSLPGFFYSTTANDWYFFLCHGGYLPRLTDWDSNKSAWKVLRCPSWQSYTAAYGDCQRTYGIRNVSSWDRILTNTNPSHTIWLADSIRLSNKLQAFNFRITDSGNTKSYIHLRHNGVANCWFLDGHVEGLTLSGLKKDPGLHAAVLGDADDCVSW